jgi:tetratricopeptide (TPR) repeat protein
MKLAIPVILLSFACLNVLGADKLEATLQKGLFEEEGNQNLDAAIQVYQSLVAAHDNDRKTAATALYRLGECYRKLGRTNEAISQFQRILASFSGPPTLAMLSRQNLVGLGASADATDAASTLPAGSSRRSPCSKASRRPGPKPPRPPRCINDTGTVARGASPLTPNGGSG